MAMGERIRGLVATVVVVALGTTCATVEGVGGSDSVDAGRAAQIARIGTPLRAASRYAVLRTIPVGHGPMGVIAGYGSVWVANHGGGTVSRLDPGTNRVVATIRLGRGPGHLVAGYGAVWVSDDSDGFLWRIDAVTNAARRIRVGGRVSCVPAVGLGKVWITVWDPPTLVGVDAATGRVVTRLPIDPQPLGVQFADGSLWAASAERGGHLQRIDPTAKKLLARIFVMSDWSWLQSFSVGDGALWVANPFVKTVARVNVRTNELDAIIDVGYVAVATFADGALWVADVTGRLARIDPSTSRTTDSMRVGTSLGGIAAAFGSIWVPSYSGDAVSRVALG